MQRVDAAVGVGEASSEREEGNLEVMWHDRDAIADSYVVFFTYAPRGTHWQNPNIPHRGVWCSGLPHVPGVVQLTDGARMTQSCSIPAGGLTT